MDEQNFNKDPDGDPSYLGAVQSGMSRRSLMGVISAVVGSTLIGMEVGLDGLPAFAADSVLYWPAGRLVVPAGGEFGNDRGLNHSPRYHQGTDLALSVGTPLYASGTGRVTGIANTGSTSGYGLHVTVDYSGTSIITAHMSATTVTVGQGVTVSTQLGRSGGAQGAAGSGSSTGPHCHVEVRKQGVLTNPGLLLSPRSLIGTTPPPPIIGESKDMPIIIRHPDGTRALLGEFLFAPYGAQSVAQANANAFNGGKTVDLNADDYFMVTSDATARRNVFRNEIVSAVVNQLKPYLDK